MNNRLKRNVMLLKKSSKKEAWKVEIVRRNRSTAFQFAASNNQNPTNDWNNFKIGNRKLVIYSDNIIITHAPVTFYSGSLDSVDTNQELGIATTRLMG